MNEVQQEIRKTITAIKAMPKEWHVAKWRNTVLKELEKLELIASGVPNQSHPHNQPLPEEPR